MRTLLSLAAAAALPFFPLFSQNQKGAAPLAQPATANPQPTRAVVIGISDYREPQIPDLKYADRDAAAFDAWLRSPEGAGLPDSNIVFLKNETATTARMITSLDWLIEASGAGDRAFIYFSGHGDVERVTKFQRGYLLSHDSPPAVYGAGAFPLNYLQDILTTLSEKNVQVVVITDACRAGKLAGSAVGGTQATAAQLAQQFANEIKILSCQPDELSLEGEQWGGGRGCFSFHLEDALYGLADANGDESIDLQEVRRYLEDHVSAEAAPQNQTPSVSGPLKTRIAQTHAAVAEGRKKERGNRKPEFRAIDNRGAEGRFLEKADTSDRRLYAQFLAAIDSGFLMKPVGGSADDFFRKILERPALAALHGTAKRKLAAALIEGGQAALNKLLLTNQPSVDDDYLFRLDERAYADYYLRAAEILGPSHYAWRNLRATEAYFRHRAFEQEHPDSSAEWRHAREREMLDEALALDSSVAVLYRGRAFTFFPDRPDESLKDILKALELAPNWVLAHYEVGIFSGSFAIGHLHRAIELAPDLLPPYATLASHYLTSGKKDSAFYWAGQFIERFSKKFGRDTNAVTAFECNAAGIAYNLTGENSKAKAALLVGRRISGGKYFPIHLNLAQAHAELFEFEEAVRSLEKCAAISGTYFLEIAGNTAFFLLDDTARAAAFYDRLPWLSTTNQLQAWATMNPERAYRLARAEMPPPGSFYWPILAFYAAESARALGMADTAAHFFGQIADGATRPEANNRGALMPPYLFAAIAAHRLGRTADFDRILVEAHQKLGDDPISQFNLACIHAQTGDPRAAVAALKKAVSFGWQRAGLFQLTGSLRDPLLDPLRQEKGFKKLVRQHFPKYYDIATRVPGRY